MSCKKFTSGSYVDKKGHLEESLCNKPLFSKVRSGTTFNIARPYFKAGTVLNKMGDVKLPVNKRKGLGNYDITRTNFIAPPIKGREVLNFERLAAQDLETAGVKVQLGDKTIEKLFKIQVNDPTDTKWIQEKNARLAGGETEEMIKANPPMGRQQRKVSKMVNFAAQGLLIEDKIEQLKAAVDQGHADNKEDMASLIANVSLLLGNLGQLRNMTQSGFNELRQLISKLTVPKHWKAMGFTHRLYNLEQYKEQAGLINLYILSNLTNLPGGRTFSLPLVSLDDKGEVVGRTSFLNMVQNLGAKNRSDGTRAPGRYLDLETKAIIPFNVAVELANDGIDNGQLNGQNTPQGPPNNGAWLQNMTPAWDYSGQVPPNTQGSVPIVEEEKEEKYA